MIRRSRRRALRAAAAAAAAVAFARPARAAPPVLLQPAAPRVSPSTSPSTSPSASPSASPRPGATVAASSPSARWLLVRRTGATDLVVLDAGDPSNPRVAGRLALPEATDLPPVFDRATRRLFVASRDGSLQRHDLAGGEPLARARVASRIAGVALASDGAHLAVAAADPPALLLLDANLRVLRALAGEDRDRKRRAPVLAVRDAPARRSFVASLPGLPELWEVSYDPSAPDIPAGMIHDFQYREGAFVRGYLNARRTPLESGLGWLRVDARGHEALGGSTSGPGLEVVHLDVRRRIATLGLDAGDGERRIAFWGPPASRSMAIADATAGGLALVDATEWKLVGRVLDGIRLRWLAAHPDANWIWLSAGAGCPATSACEPGSLRLIDKREPRAPAIPPARLATRLREAVVQVEFDAAMGLAHVVVVGPNAGIATVSADGSREIAFVPLPGAAGLVCAPG